jgi:hypothetical protein
MPMLLGVLWGMGGYAVAATEPLVLKEWTFDQDVEGWGGANTTPLKVEDGALVFSAAGKDVILQGPLFELTPEVGDVLEIRIRSTTEGTAEWFWRPTTEGQYEGFSPDMRSSVRLGAGEEWQTLRTQPLWQGLARIVGIRFDPPEGLEGTYAVDSVRILRFARGEPVAADFDFTTGDHGWSSPAGECAATDGGLRFSLPDSNARLVSPALKLDAGADAWIELDFSAPRVEGFRDFVPAELAFIAEASPDVHAVPIRVATERRSRYFVHLAHLPEWAGNINTLLLRVTAGMPVELTLHSLRAIARPEQGAVAGPATGYEFRTQPWHSEYRLPVAPTRIDVATQAPPETHPVSSRYTVAMWYFAAWEPEYTWDGWQQVAERSPWRLPLLYDSGDAQMRFNGIQFYRASDPRAIDWHVHWMREHAVNLMLWDWYPRRKEDGSFDPSFFANRALEIGFLGKAAVGDPPAPTNRFAETMPFAVMWTNHAPHNQLGTGLADYTVDQFFSQPNYYRLDGKPLLVLWSVHELIGQAGGEEQAKAVLDDLRAKAQAKGLPGVYVAAIGGEADLLHRVGIDGVTGYHYSGSGGNRAESRRLGDRTVQDFVEDYPSQTIPGHVRIWTELAEAFGKDYLLATTPMQNWEPTFRGAGPVMQNNTPDTYREMLRRAKAFIDERGLRPFVNIEAWNEWLEGSYMEPSTQWGYEYLEAVKDVFGDAAKEP